MEENQETNGRIENVSVSASESQEGKGQISMVAKGQINLTSEGQINLVSKGQINLISEGQINMVASKINMVSEGHDSTIPSIKKNENFESWICTFCFSCFPKLTRYDSIYIVFCY